MLYFFIALLSAILFGASTPVGKILLNSMPPFQLAGLLYLGAALGVLPFSLRERHAAGIRTIGKTNIFRLAGAIGFGGVLGPVLLLFGLQIASAASVAMWLNLELAATAILGYFLFHDHLGRYGWIGVAGTLSAAVLLSWHEGGGIGGYALLLVGGASLCWGLDNHLTALIDGITPTQSTCWKGLIAGTTNLMISWLFESYSTLPWPITSGIIIGVFSYGFSISLYILAAQHLGATRSQMIFSSAPFFGVTLSALILGESISPLQYVAALVLILSLITLHRDQHAHLHTHAALTHQHQHRHDDNHHGHAHPADNDAAYHHHWHDHEPVTHSDPHWPDIHHRHEHNDHKKHP